MKSTSGLILLLLAALLTPVPSSGETMEVTIDVLEPTDRPGELPPGLRYLEETMSRSPLKYQNYLNLATAFRQIPLGWEETIRFHLRQDLKLVIIPNKLEASLVRFHLRLWSDGRLILDSELSLARRGTVMIGAPGTPNLIIAVSEGF
ncbi:MAG: hypothetical protein APR56_09745 [Methanosaeta sp. SDB]|nr:MAG: hypothetical protein APR56_09745 [Methanosaeta sp. SDB]